MYLVMIDVDCEVRTISMQTYLSYLKFDNDKEIEKLKSATNSKIAGNVHQELETPCCSSTLGSYHGLGYHLRCLVHYQESYDMP